MAPRFSILLPTHNRADVIGLAIESVLAQTERNFELLVVGDGCTDNTSDVVEAFADPRIRWFDLPKAWGFGYANRNVALREARGDFIAFLAHDDLVLSDHLELLAKTLDETGADWVYSRPLWVSTDGIVVPFAVNLTNPLDLDAFLNERNTIPASCVLHRRSCFELYGYWPEDLERAGDWEMWKKIIRGGGGRNLAYCPIPTVLHFVAIWKRDRAGFRFVKSLLDIADASAWWPPRLRPDVAEEIKEQEVFAKVMTSGGDAWRDGLRQDVRVVLDYLAWSNIVEAQPTLKRQAATIPKLEKKLEKLEQKLKTAGRAEIQLSAAQAEINRLATDLRQMKSSRSWRLTAPLRSLLRFVGGPLSAKEQ